MENKQLKYVEPEGYFSKGMRKALGIGEYAKEGSKETPSKSKKTKSVKKK